MHKGLLPSIGFNLPIHIYSCFSLAFPLGCSQPLFVERKVGGALSKRLPRDRLFKPIQTPSTFVTTVSGISFYAQTYSALQELPTLLLNVLLFSSTSWTSYLDSAKRCSSILHWILQKPPWSSKAVHSSSCHFT